MADAPVHTPPALPPHGRGGGAGVAAAGASRDVAIGVAKGLKAEAIRTYVMTLRQFSQADVFLYVDAIPADMPAQPTPAYPRLGTSAVGALSQDDHVHRP